MEARFNVRVETISQPYKEYHTTTAPICQAIGWILRLERVYLEGLKGSGRMGRTFGSGGGGASKVAWC